MTQESESRPNRTKLWSANISIRPHHYSRDILQNVLLGKLNPESAAQQDFDSLFEEMKKTPKAATYWKDLGISIFHRRQVQRSYERFYSEIYQLKNDDIVLFDVKPDGFCRSCIIGKHCPATNFEIDTPGDDIYQIETECVEDIIFCLESMLFLEGVEYITKKAPRVFQDYQGRPLGSKVLPIPKQVEFKTLMVKVGPLRVLTEDLQKARKPITMLY